MFNSAVIDLTSGKHDFGRSSAGSVRFGFRQNTPSSPIRFHPEA
jgi:hypothetical protein